MTDEFRRLVPSEQHRERPTMYPGTSAMTTETRDPGQYADLNGLHLYYERVTGKADRWS